MRNTKVNATALAAIVWVIVFALGMITDATAQGNSQKIDYYQQYWVPCANGGEGEMITITGTFNIVQNVSMDNNGCYHVSVHGNSMGMTAVGEETGDTYRANGNFSQVYVDESLCEETCDVYFTTVDNFLMIAPGKNGAKYREHLIRNWHLDVCTNELTLVDQKATFSCE